VYAPSLPADAMLHWHLDRLHCGRLCQSNVWSWYL